LTPSDWPPDSLFGDLGIMSPDAKGSKQQGKEAA